MISYNLIYRDPDHIRRLEISLQVRTYNLAEKKEDSYMCVDGSKC